MTAKVATFVDDGEGPKLSLVTESGQFVISISDGMVANLNADCAKYLRRLVQGGISGSRSMSGQESQNLAARLAAAVHLESAYISPATSPLIEASKEAVVLLRRAK